MITKMTLHVMLIVPLTFEDNISLLIQEKDVGFVLQAKNVKNISSQESRPCVIAQFSLCS